MIKNKKIWITGASSGIGSELAVQLADTGNTVVVSARSTEKLEALAQLSSPMSGSIVPLAYDVTQDEQSDAVRNSLEGMVGHLDMVIICAGRCEYVDDAVLEIDLFRRVYDVNVFGAVNSATNRK